VFGDLLRTNTRNSRVVYDIIARMDLVLGSIKYAKDTGLSAHQFNSALLAVKLVHDDLQKIEALQEYSNTLNKHVDTLKKLHDYYIANNTTTGVNLNKDYSMGEGADYRLSKQYYNAQAKRWMQHKVEVVDKEKKKSYEKEAIKLAGQEFSFKDFYAESQLNSTSRLQQDGDVTTNGDDTLYIDKSKKVVKPKFKTKSEIVQADPMSS